MRKLIVCNIVSVDGCYSGPGDDVMAMPFDDGFDEYNAERLRAAGTVLLGRVSYEGFEQFWPEVVHDLDASAAEREVSQLMNAIDKVVVSDTLDPNRASPWAATTRLVPVADRLAAVAELKRGAGGDIVVFGSHRLWNDLLDAGLVDELHLTIGPGVVGPDGARSFTGPPRRLRLADIRRFPGSSLLLTVYHPEPEG